MSARRFFRTCLALWLALVLLSGCGGQRPLEIPAEYEISQEPSIGYLHFSVDDCHALFRDLTENADRYDSIFEQPTLRFAKELHDEFGIKISFYVFYSPSLAENSFDLSRVTDAYRQEFTANAHWLRFGYHAPDAQAYQDTDAALQAQYYQLTVKELLRITGSAECIDNFVRLDRYLADAETRKILAEEAQGITGLLIADRSTPERDSYALSQAAKATCYEKDWYTEDGIAYTPTDIRLEDITDDDAFYRLLKAMETEPRLVVFTHEWALEQESVRQYMRWLAEYAKQCGIPFVFPENDPQL